MTVIPDAEGQLLSLVCDTCGQAVKDIDSPPDQWTVVWAVISRTGWTGTPLALGPHHCPQCGEHRAAAESTPVTHPKSAERSQS